MDDANLLTTTSAALPFGVFLLMVCVGFELTLSQFAGLKRQPQAIVVGLGCQQLLAPICGLAVAWFWRDWPAVALGAVLLVASPGGSVANGIVHLGRGRLDLSVTLSGVNGVLCVVLTPLIVAIGFGLFGPQAEVPALGHGQAAPRLLLAVVLPVAIGMWLRRRFVSETTLRRVRRCSAVLLCLVVGLAMSRAMAQWDLNWAHCVAAATVLSGAMLVSSDLVARSLGLDADTRFTIAIESSVHNVPIVVMLAHQVLEQPHLAGVAMAYVPVMTVMTMAWVGSRRLWRRS